MDGRWHRWPSCCATSTRRSSRPSSCTWTSDPGRPRRSRPFRERQRNEVMVRIATLDGIQPLALKDLNEVMSKVAGRRPHEAESNLGGVKTGRRDHQPDGLERRDLGASTTCARGRQRPGPEDHGQHVHLRRSGEDRRQGNPVATLKEVQSESLVVASMGAVRLRCAKRVQRTRRRKAARDAAQVIWKRGPARSPRSRPSRSWRCPRSRRSAGD